MVFTSCGCSTSLFCSRMKFMMAIALGRCTLPLHSWYVDTLSTVNLLIASQDTMEGVYPRWNVSFNITVLRLISFGLDFNWASRAIDIGSDVGERNPSKVNAG